jgi:Tfp pilus assembly PilM family ATPase
MKITINIDCTPEEARTFMGLPDVKPMQEMMMQEVQERMKANLAAMDPETLFKTWLPTGISNIEQLQKMFWSQFNNPTQNGSKE